MRLKGWLWLIGILVVINMLLSMFGRQYRFDSVLIHHSAGRVGDLAMIKNMHTKRGWSDAAYHLILSNGSTTVPAGFLEASGRFASLSYAGATKDRDANLRDLHICIIGNYEDEEMPEALRPPLAHALVALCDEFSIDHNKIVFHNDVGNTACPGKNLIKNDVLSWMDALSDKCPAEIRQQQLDTIATSSLSLSNYPRGLLVVQLCISFILTSAWLGLVFAFKPKTRKRLVSKPRKRTKNGRIQRKKPRSNRHR